jgi:hypothetical protein
VNISSVKNSFLKASVMASSLMPAATLAATTQAPQGTDCNPVDSSNPISSGAQCATSKSSAGDLFGPNGIFHTIADV